MKKNAIVTVGRESVQVIEYSHMNAKHTKMYRCACLNEAGEKTGAHRLYSHDRLLGFPPGTLIEHPEWAA